MISNIWMRGQVMGALTYYHNEGLQYVPIKEVSERVAVYRSADPVSMRGPVAAILEGLRERGLVAYQKDPARGSTYRLVDDRD